MLQSLDGPAVRRWAATCCDVLAAHCDEIDALNVFPFPDQDTGSNLLATMRAGLDAVLRDQGQDRNVPPGSTVAVLARGALMGARGSSGVILSQVLRGLAEPLIGGDAESAAPMWDGAALQEGLRRADELAMAAVSDPAPGTVLTVLHAAAQAAAAVRSGELGEVASAATAAAVGALAGTPSQVATPATAGVVDAAGRGLILLLEALLAVVTERPVIRPAAMTSCTCLADHISGEHTGQAVHDRLSTSHAVLVMVAGSGVAELCRGEGAATAPPTSSVADLLSILGATHARHVTVLAEPSAVPTAEIVAARARGDGQEVVVVPAASPVQALAAVAVHDSARQPAEDVAAMTDAVTGIRCGELTLARDDALTGAGHCQVGEVVGVLGDQVVVINRDPLAAACELVARMLAVGGELGTVLLGRDAPDGFGDALIGQLCAAHPDVEMMVYAGDVPERVLLVGVE